MPVVVKDSVAYKIRITEEIRICDYFDFMDSLVAQYDSLLPYPFTEHLLVRANDWLIDSLAATDYYRMMDKGIFAFHQEDLVILSEGDSLLVPDKDWAEEIICRQSLTSLDINIPEFKLRIKEADSMLFEFLVRVGKNKERYLAMAGHVVDLKTKTGTGKIIKINRDPSYINPADNKIYKRTRRDDGKYTALPRIPWLTPEIDGHRWGATHSPHHQSQNPGQGGLQRLYRNPGGRRLVDLLLRPRRNQNRDPL